MTDKQFKLRLLHSWLPTALSIKTSNRINALTPAQEARLAPFADEWIAHGLNTEPADWDTFASAAQRCYEFAGLPWHGRVVRVSNPFIGAMTSLLSAYWPASRSAVRGAVRGAVSGAVSGAVDCAVRGAVRGVDASAWTKGLIGGSWWLAWIAWRDFFLTECGLDLGKEIIQKHISYRDANRSACWWWVYRDFVIVSDRPQAIHRQQIGPRGWGSHRMHCRSGPAIAWRDGWSLWFIEGIQISRQIVEFPETITVAMVAAETNAEKRRIMMRQFGPAPGARDDDYDGTLAYLRAVGSELIDADGGTRAIGSAPRCLIEIRDDNWPRWLVLTDGSTNRVYTIPANRDAATVATALERINGGIPDDALYAES